MQQLLILHEPLLLVLFEVRELRLIRLQHALQLGDLARQALLLCEQLVLCVKVNE